MKYSIEVKSSVVKALKRIPRDEQIQIVKLIQSLTDNPRPHNCTKLSNSAYYRIRYGVYRIIYDIQDAKLVIIIFKVGHRKDIYR